MKYGTKLIVDGIPMSDKPNFFLKFFVVLTSYYDIKFSFTFVFFPHQFVYSSIYVKFFTVKDKAWGDFFGASERNLTGLRLELSV